MQWGQKGWGSIIAPSVASCYAGTYISAQPRLKKYSTSVCFMKLLFKKSVQIENIEKYFVRTKTPQLLSSWQEENTAV